MNKLNWRYEESRMDEEEDGPSIWKKRSYLSVFIDMINRLFPCSHELAWPTRDDKEIVLVCCFCHKEVLRENVG